MPAADAQYDSRGPRSLAWWTGGRGFAGVAQWPNPALAVWMVATLVRRIHGADDQSTDQLLDGIATGALIVWAVDEVVRGVSPIRRVMGVLVLVALTAAFLM